MLVHRHNATRQRGKHMNTSIHRSVRRMIAAALVVVVVAIAGTCSIASAATYWSTGTLGSATIPNGVCKFNSAWGRLDAAIDPPSIYARNTTSAVDAQWVRYQVYVVDARGVTVRSSGYSGFALAYDNRPAPFSGATKFENIPSGSKLDVRIEWWNSTQMVGALAFRVEGYTQITGTNGSLWYPYCTKSL
jgi:hypothetical protein